MQRGSLPLFATVHEAEQRASLAKVLRLADHRTAPANDGRGGEDTSAGGEDEKKPTEEASSNRLLPATYLVGAAGI